MSAPSAAAPHRTISASSLRPRMHVPSASGRIHEAITAELTAHWRITRPPFWRPAPDMPLREAERRAVEAMGNPEELGPLAGLHPQSPLGVAPDLVRSGQWCWRAY